LQPQIVSVSAVAAFLLKPSFAAAAHCLFPSASGEVWKLGWSPQELVRSFAPTRHALLQASVAPLGHPAVRRHSIVRVHADGCGYATRVPCLNFPGISDGIRGRTDIVNNRLTTNPTSSYLQMIKASSSTLESQQACERQCLATCETSSYFD
jgi:hypothetical protein